MNAYPFLTWIAPGIMLPLQYEVPVNQSTMRPFERLDVQRDSATEAEETSAAHVAVSSLVALASVALLAFAH